MGLLTRQDGMVAQTPEEAHQLQMAGYEKCYNNRVMTGSRRGNRWYGLPCPFWLSPDTQHRVETQMGGYYTCPFCYEVSRLRPSTMALAIIASMPEVPADHERASHTTR
jgi:hypothetical protein